MSAQAVGRRRVEQARYLGERALVLQGLALLNPERHLPVAQAAPLLHQLELKLGNAFGEAEGERLLARQLDLNLRAEGAEGAGCMEGAGSAEVPRVRGR